MLRVTFMRRSQYFRFYSITTSWRLNLSPTVAHTHTPIITPHTHTMFYFERFSLLRTSATTDPPSQFSILEFKNQMIFLSRYLVFSRSAAGQELCYHGASRWETAHSRRLRNNKHALVSLFHSAVDGVLFPSGSKPRRACSDTTGMFFWERTLLIFL